MLSVRRLRTTSEHQTTTYTVKQRCATFFAGGPISDFLKISRANQSCNACCFYAQMCFEAMAGGSLLQNYSGDFFVG